MRRRPLPPDLRLLAREQSGCVSRRQLAAHGVGPDAVAVARHVSAGRWQRVDPQAVVLHTGLLGPDERRWCAVLASGGVLAGRAALAVHGLEGWEQEQVDVVVARTAGRRSPPWVRLRTTGRCAARDVTRRGGLPVHVVERAAVDAAAWSVSSRTAGASSRPSCSSV